MNDITLTIQVNKPATYIFAFTINPKNTPRYIDSVVAEETNEWPVKVGTIYRNRGENSEWSEYEVTEFKENEMFEMRKKKDDTLVRYTFKPIDSSRTELEYYVRINNGELDESFVRSIVEKLKVVLEE